MLKHIFNKVFTKIIHSLLKKKLASFWGAPQENDAKFRFAIHPQGIRQFLDNCKVPDCCHIGSGGLGLKSHSVICQAAQKGL